MGTPWPYLWHEICSPFALLLTTVSVGATRSRETWDSSCLQNKQNYRITELNRLCWISEVSNLLSFCLLFARPTSDFVPALLEKCCWTEGGICLRLPGVVPHTPLPPASPISDISILVKGKGIRKGPFHYGSGREAWRRWQAIPDWPCPAPLESPCQAHGTGPLLSSSWICQSRTISLSHPSVFIPFLLSLLQN